MAGAAHFFIIEKYDYLRFLAALDASIARFISRRFFVFFERDFLPFSIPVALFAIEAHYTLFAVSGGGALRDCLI